MMNILKIGHGISDDQSWAHKGANGEPVVHAPAFDRIARESLRFVNPFCNVPTCSPSPSAILRGKAVIPADRMLIIN